MKVSQKLRSLSLSDYQLIFWAMVLLPVTGLRLRFQGFKKVHAWANCQLIRHLPLGTDAKRRSNHLGKLINYIAVHGFYRANCLSRSLVLLRAMRREGLQGELRIGVPKESGSQALSVFNAHAWVEYQGLVINDDFNVVRKYAIFNFN